MIQKVSLIFITIFLLSCGPSDQEKQNIATITCNIMGESRNMDAAMRIKEINFAREKLAEEPFLEGDAKIKESFEYGLCKQLVINDPEYDLKLISIKTQIELREAEREAERKIKREEERKVEERKEKERKEELKRIADAKASKERKEREDKIKEFSSILLKIIQENPPELKFIRAYGPLRKNRHNPFGFTFKSKNIYGLEFKYVLNFKDYGQLQTEKYCFKPEKMPNECFVFFPVGGTFIDMTEWEKVNEQEWRIKGYSGRYLPSKNSSSISDPLTLHNFLKDMKNPIDLIESIYVYPTGRVYVNAYMDQFKNKTDALTALSKWRSEYSTLSSIDNLPKFVLYESKN